VHCFDFEELVYLPFYGTKPVCLTPNKFYVDSCDEESGLVDEEAVYITEYG